MSIKVKLPALVMIAFLINILLLYGYYNYFLSNEISQYNNEIQQQLQTEADQISTELKDTRDFESALIRISQEKNMIIHVEDEDGKAVFHTGNETGVNVETSASSLFHYNNRIYLLKLTKPILLTDLSSFDIALNLFKAEVIIICFILLSIAFIVYFQYAKPIIRLKESMEHYKTGIRPKKIMRLDEIGSLQNRFVELTDTIEDEKQKQNRIIASISHDIKTPLTSVMGYAERLKKNSLPDEKHEQYVNTIYNKSVSIKNLIEEFDEYLSYHMRGELKLQRITTLQLCGILRSDYEEEFKERGIAFNINNDETDELLFVDISKMRRVFGNIIGNSLKHLNKTGPLIDVLCETKEESVFFSVEDNGTGVTKEELNNIFEPFYTSDKSRSVAGLGLSICKEIVESHGGEIWAENKKRKGL